MWLTLFVLGVLIGNSFSSDCYWRGWPLCGFITTCPGRDHFIRYGLTARCLLSPDKFCCPAGDGNDIMMCEHKDFKGKCISQSVGEKKCVNVDNQDWTSSINTFGNCFRLYQDSDCLGRSIAVYPGSKSHNDLEDLKFNDMVSSISNCFKADPDVDKCRSKRAADGRCQWFADIATIGFLAWRQRDTLVSAPLRYYQSGPSGRTESMEALILPQHLGTGSNTNQNARTYARSMGRPNDDAGHILAQRLGGSGTDLRNIFPQSPNINRGLWSQMEEWVDQVVRQYGSALFNVNLEYEGSATRPTRIIFRICRGDTGDVIYIDSIPNP